MKKKFLYIFLTFFIFNFYIFSSVKDLKLYYHLNRGNKNFKEKKYDRSLSEYMKAESIKPDSPVVSFDIADTLYKKGEYKKAADTFMKILHEKTKISSNLKNKIFYNLGNCFFRLKEYSKALEMYKKVLLRNDKDEDARKNYEITLKKIREKKNKNKKEENKKNNNKNKGDRKKNKKSKQNKKKNKKGEENKKKNREKKEKKRKKSENNKNKVSKGKENLKKFNPKILEGLKEEEKKMIQQLIKNKFKNIKKSGKDW